MTGRFYVILLLVIIAISISQREVFAPIIPSENDSYTSNITGTVSQGSYEFTVPIIIIGIILIGVLIYIFKIKYRKSDSDL
jgi:glucan phosphoethanolaminetransferase (alkaline phosphatase superfamily)